MSVLRQHNWLGQQRVDVPHLRALDSSITADFDLLAGSILAGKKGLVVTGFDLVTGSALNNPATSLQLNVAGGIVMHASASEAGTIFAVADGAAVETLDATNPNVSGSFTPGQVNYVGLDLTRSADSDTSDLVMFWDPNASEEAPKTVPLARTLNYKLVISTTDFDSKPNVLPLAKVTTNSSNVVTAIEDARQLSFRLGSGGSSPDKGNSFTWPQGRDEGTSSTVFSGGDKAIGSLKSWMDAVMTRLWELGGGEFWYSASADRNATLVWSGANFANGENFSWDGTNLTWQGLTFVFDNSTGYYNTVTNQTVANPGQTDLADGDCLYVDLDRAQNAAVVAKKNALSLLGPGNVPGARQVLAWRQGSNVFTRGSKYPVGYVYAPATTTSLGVVKLSKAPTLANSPVVLTDTEKNAANGVAILDGSLFVHTNGLTRDTDGQLVLGNGAHDTSVLIGRGSMLTQIAGNLTVIGTIAAAHFSSTVQVDSTSTFTGRLTASAGITISTGGMTVTAGGLTITAGGLTVGADTATNINGGLNVALGLSVTGGVTINNGLSVASGSITIASPSGLTASGGTVSAFTISGNSVTSTTTITAGGKITSNSGGFQFPDGTTQTSAAVTTSSSVTHDTVAEASITGHGGTSAARIVKNALGVVDLTFRIATTPSTGNLIVTLSTGFRPLIAMRVPCAEQGSPNARWVDINTDGTITAADDFGGDPRVHCVFFTT
jgi:hypothetical protein